MKETVDPGKSKRKRSSIQSLTMRKSGKSIWGKIFFALLILFVVGVVLFGIVQAIGKNRLYRRAVQNGMALQEVLTDLEGISGNGEEWQEGWVRYQGKIYAYNEDLLTFLVLGIDKMEEVQKGKDGIDGGQSDVLFLVALNPHTKQIEVVAINRNTMADVDIYDRDGNFLATEKKQITLQHGYGDGMEQSCERSVQAVSRLFYGLPIHGYCAVNMGAIPLINDAVGGVDVTVLESLENKKNGFSFKEGEQVHLEGMSAFWYVKYRDAKIFNSATSRLQRQKQYMQAWAAKAKEKMRLNPGLAIELYQTLNRYMVTDVSLDEVSYLAATCLTYDFPDENMYSLEGEAVLGADDFEEFYLDEEALYQLILDVFYEEVEQ